MKLNLDLCQLGFGCGVPMMCKVFGVCIMSEALYLIHDFTLYRHAHVDWFTCQCSQLAVVLV